MKTFFMSLITPNSGVSSRRFISIISLFTLIGFSLTSLFIPVETHILYTFAGLVTSGSIAASIPERKS